VGKIEKKIGQVKIKKELENDEFGDVEVSEPQAD
jgi:hypothetical protein